jgi:predicted CoA-substrate-specific enzyme activase
MLVGGIDIGSATGKAVIMGDGEIVGSAVLASVGHPVKTAEAVMEKALDEAGLTSVEEIDNVVSTGYGRLNITYASENLSEIACHGKGAFWLDQSLRTVIDIGGQDCKVISISDTGSVIEFAMNDRCAAGTGRFFESIARALCCGLEGLSDLDRQGETPAKITHQCTVFAESEVITLVNEGESMDNIISGINTSVAKRVSAMVRRVGLLDNVAMTGGCSKNLGLAKALAKSLKTEVHSLPGDPQLAGAIGAAVFAGEKLVADPA